MQAIPDSIKLLLDYSVAHPWLTFVWLFMLTSFGPTTKIVMGRVK